MDYIKHFNQQTENYLLYRPRYPEALYHYLLGLVAKPHCVWDCGTGNGQAAIALAQYFDQVIATDINQQQLDVATQHAKVSYCCCPAESTTIPDESVDLITVGQALHWFNFDLFYQEVRRVSKPKAVIAAWCYSLGKINNTIDKVINKLYLEILGDEYWPRERHYIDENYQTIPFPFAKILTPPFTIEKDLNFAQLLGYLTTWSAVKEYQERKQINPLSLIVSELSEAWGNPEQRYIMHWPIHLLAAYTKTYSS